MTADAHLDGTNSYPAGEKASADSERLVEASQALPPYETDRERRLREFDESIRLAIVGAKAGDVIDADVVFAELEAYIDALPAPTAR